MKDLTLTEEMFLLAVWKLKDNAYGVTIRKHVSKETKRIYPYGTLYSALDKLTRNITPEGISALRTALELKKKMWDEATELALKET
jgi:hypothetical protein